MPSALLACPPHANYWDATNADAAVIPSIGTLACKFFLRDTCKRGANCLFSHSASADSHNSTSTVEAAGLNDTDGHELCLKHALRGRSCRWTRKPDRCNRSHRTPSAQALVLLDAMQKDKESATLQVASERQAAAKAALLLPLPAWLHRHRETLRFPVGDCSAFGQLRTAAARFLCKSGLAEGLTQLHVIDGRALPEEPPLCPSMISAFKRAGYKLPALWRKALLNIKKTVRRLEKDESYQDYVAAYKELVRETVLPLCGDATGIVFQCPPTMRVHLPGFCHTIKLHCDSEYEGHENSEINFWIPLTPAFDSNTLYKESEPEKGDFEPVNMDVGEGLRFNGYECRHYTVPNRTGETRVSFDFRVIPRSLYRNDHDGTLGDYPVETIAMNDTKS